MPRLSVWFLRTALVYLAAGFTFGALMLANKGVPFSASMWALLPAHEEFLLLGWMVQLAFGVGFWILPRYSGGSRGNVHLAWLSFELINAGVLLVAGQEILGLPALMGGIGRAAEAGSAVAFALHAWGRVRPAYP
jgi:hypothetical protein